MELEREKFNQSSSGYKFRDRAEAGRKLAGHLTAFAGRPDEVIVLALPRGGVPVGAEVARELHCPLDVIIVRKLGVPGQSEYAMGAIASPGVCELNSATIDSLGITKEQTDYVLRQQTVELERQGRLYRGDRPTLDLTNREVILVDDGLATGITMLAAVSAARKLGAGRIVVAIPVGSVQGCEQLQSVAQRVVCPVRLNDFVAVSYWYDDFHEVTDREVLDLLAASRRS